MKENNITITEGKLNLDSDTKIAIINARLNYIITDHLVEDARNTFLRHGGKEENLSLILVPGAFELPFTLKKAIGSKKFDAICHVGTVIRGLTPHSDYVSAKTIKGIANISLNRNISVNFGVSTTDTIEQAAERTGGKAGNKGFRAIITVIEVLDSSKEF